MLAAQAALDLCQDRARRGIRRWSRRTRRPRPRSITGIYEKASAEAQLLGAQAQVALAKLNLELYRSQGAVRRHRRQAPDRSRQCRRRRRPAERARRDHPARPDLCGRQSERTGGAEDSRESGPASAYPRRSAQGPGRCRRCRTRPGFRYQGTIEYVAPGHRPGDRNLAGARHSGEPGPRPCCPGFSSTSACRWERSTATHCWCPTARLQEDQGGRYLLIVNKDDVVEQRYVQLGQLMGACGSSPRA